MAAPSVPVSLADKHRLFSEHWSPRVVGEFNDLLVKAVKIQGEFVWHAHDHLDEIFLVTKGCMVIQLRDGNVALGAGEFYVVPRGVEHCPMADEECEILLFEPPGVVNTGTAPEGELTAAIDPWI